jgi:ABC-2 type transport system permease protein
MKKTLIVMRNEIRTTLGRKAFTIMALGLPLLLGVAALVVMTINRDTGAALETTRASGEAEAGRPLLEGYVDEGGLIKTLPEDVPADGLMPYPDEVAAQAALDAHVVDAYYIIPADYLESGDVTYVRLDFSPISDETSNHDRIEWVLLVNLFGGDAEAAAAVWRPLEVHWQQAPSPQVSDNGAGADSWVAHLLPNLMAFSLYMVIIIPAGTLVSAVADEKKNRVMEVLISSLSPRQMMGGKILALGLLGLLQITLWVGILWAVVRFGGQPLNIPPGFSVPTELLVWAFVYGLLGYILYGAQMAGLGALVPDIKDSRGAAFVILLPLIVVYVFLAIIVERPDSPLAIAFSLFPLTSPVGMIARMAATEVPLWQPALAALFQLLTAILSVRLVARLFHAQTLLSGQPFSVKRFFGALLGWA